MDDFYPSVIQGFDKSLWIFYSSDYPLGNEFDIYYIKSNSISQVHNVIVSQIQAGPTVFQNSGTTILVTVTNVGDFAETIQVTVTAGTHTIASAVAKSVPLGATITFTFAWNTTSIPTGQYVITASYPRLTGQSLLASGGDQLQYKYLTLLPPFTHGGCHGFHNCPT
jgi:hypothetical protein